mmetsp:Transcript_13586/g.31173  ORF Transcript_13586/g.31173 Transcript_13586/m.31173 type:complete len:209 (-) Transcript_13586:712-1338(-)
MFYKLPSVFVNITRPLRQITIPCSSPSIPWKYLNTTRVSVRRDRLTIGVPFVIFEIPHFRIARPLLYEIGCDPVREGPRPRHVNDFVELAEPLKEGRSLERVGGHVLYDVIQYRMAPCGAERPLDGLHADVVAAYAFHAGEEPGLAFEPPILYWLYACDVGVSVYPPVMINYQVPHEVKSPHALQMIVDELVLRIVLHHELLATFVVV